MKVAMFMVLLGVAPVLHAGAGGVVLVLRDDLIAPAVRVRTLNVYSDGVVTEEHYDISQGSTEKWPSNGTNQLGKLGPSELERINVYISSGFRRLPKIVNSEGPVRVDGPSQSICVTVQSKRTCSTWHDYTETAKQRSAQEFRRDWQTLMQLLQSAGVGA